MWILTLITRILAGLLILATGLSLVESNEWWIRIWDFPRLQVLGALIIAAGLSLWADRALGRWISVGCMLAAAWQLYRIYPYTPLARSEVAFAARPSQGGEVCFDVLSLNVKQSNRDYLSTARLIDRLRPDILLLMETDQRWTDALSEQLRHYPHVLANPLENKYGMILASTLVMSNHRVSVEQHGTPVISAELVAGTPFRIIALHPRPPVPGQDTDARDAEIARAARSAARERLPVLAIGDFNDVAWSHTSRLFKRIGGYLDPRIGRGTYPTFPAEYPLLGWPLDHLFITPEFVVRSLAVLENVGSDHLPVSATLCLVPAAGGNRLPDPATIEDRKDVRDILEAAGSAEKN